MEISGKIPGMLIICGQFIKEKNIRDEEDLVKLKEKFKDFKKLLTTYKIIVDQMKITLIPGKNYLLNMCAFFDFFRLQ